MSAKPPATKPWDRLPDEPAAQYVRFMTYLSLGPSRSLIAAYLAYSADTTATPKKTTAKDTATPETDDAATETDTAAEPETAPINGATEGSERQHVPGSWSRASARWEWPKRARAHDVEQLLEHGRETVILLVHALRGVALKALEALADENVKPNTWSELITALNCLGSHVPPEAISRLVGETPTPPSMPRIAGQR
jgi:hypothetical protein